VASASRIYWSGSNALLLALSVNALGPFEACEASNHNRVDWSQDLYLRRMGEQMAQHCSVDDYRPTAMNLAEVEGLRVKLVSWISALEMFPSDP
jgi:hypothetical protein